MPPIEKNMLYALNSAESSSLSKVAARTISSVSSVVLNDITAKMPEFGELSEKAVIAYDFLSRNLTHKNPDRLDAHGKLTKVLLPRLLEQVCCYLHNCTGFLTNSYIARDVFL